MKINKNTNKICLLIKRQKIDIDYDKNKYKIEVDLIIY